MAKSECQGGEHDNGLDELGGLAERYRTPKGTGVDSPESNIASAGLTTLKALMRQAEVDQDLNCRTIGRLDREVWDLVPQRDGTATPLSEDLGRAFLYCRYDADLSRAGLDELGLPDIEPKDVAAMDDVQAMPEFTVIGQKLAGRLDLAHFGSFIRQPLAVVP